MDIEYIKVSGSSMKDSQPTHDTPLCAGRYLWGVAKTCATLGSASGGMLIKEVTGADEPALLLLLMLTFANRYCRHAYQHYMYSHCRC
jgi:hypothetical protein